MHQPRQALAGRNGDRGRWSEPAHRATGGPGPIDIYLARHGETTWSATGQHTGLTDIPLVAAGEERARLLGGRLGGRKFEAVYCSTLTRAIQTSVLAGYPPTETTGLLVEVDYGKYDGITTREIRETNPDWDLWRDGCPGGEKIPQVLKRARQFLDLALHHEGDVIAFSHGHFLKAVACVFLELPIEAANRLSLDTAALSILHRGDRGPQLELWNDTGHLPEHGPAAGSDH